MTLNICPNYDLGGHLYNRDVEIASMKLQIFRGLVSIFTVTILIVLCLFNAFLFYQFDMCLTVGSQ